MTKGKVIFACVGCAAVGFVAGWGARALVKKKNEELEENNHDKIKIKIDLADPDEAEWADNLYRKRYGNSIFSESEKDAIEQANAESEAPSEEDYEEGDPETDPDYAEDYASAPYDPDDDYDDYKPMPRYDQTGEDYDEDDYESEEVHTMHKRNVWPYEISVDEFEEDNDFSKSTLEYFKNNVLIDEDGSVIKNPGSLIGNGVLKNLMVSKKEAYVRNESLEIDYEIIYVDENYEDDGEY